MNAVVTNYIVCWFMRPNDKKIITTRHKVLVLVIGIGGNTF